MAEDSELWDIICDGPYVPIKVLEELPFSMPKTSKEYTDVDRKVVEKNFRAKKILVYGIRPEEYNRISACDTAEEMMKDDESIQDMHRRFTSIINELHSLGETIPKNKLVRKILIILPSSWESKVNAITESKDLQDLTIEELQEFSKYNPEKAAKRNPIPLKDFKRKRSADNVVKHALVAWGDSSNESEDETDAGDSSMMAVESEENEYDSTFALMAQSDDDEDNDNKEVTFRDVQRNLKSYTPKKLMSLANVLIDAYYNLMEDKDYLILELREVDKTRDDLVACVVDLKETICELKREKYVLTKRIANLEHERDDLVVVVLDHKETIENFSKEKEALARRVTEIEEEIDDLLVEIADLRETMKGLRTKSKPKNTGKGKEIANEEHIRLENELKAVRTRMCVETDKNKHLQTELERVKNDLEKSLKWTWSSEAITAMNINNSRNMQGIGFQREKIPYNPLSKCVTVPKNWLSTHYGNNGHVMENCQTRVQFTQKNRMVAENICDKGNKVEFLSKICTVTDLVTDDVVLVAKRYKNIYVADFESLQSGDLSCLKVVDDDAELWHRTLGYASFSLLNKLIQKDLVHGLPMSKFKVQKVCDACARGKHVKSSFRSKRDVSTSKPLELLHMDLCSPMRVQSRGGKRYIFVIVDDYFKFIWTLFLRTKDETFEVFVAFVKKIQFCNENGITHNLSAPRNPQQNGVVERKNKALEEMARTMLIDSGIVKNFWAEVVNTAYYLVNRCMIRSLMNKTPYELLNGRKPKLTHHIIFGCKCYVLNNGKDQLGKFDTKSDEGIFLDYSSQSKAYKIYNKRTQCVEESVHDIFDESYPSCETDVEEDQDGEPY
ncbi:intracellular protein transport protein USO1-like [Nicotiana sylvestris]|uniref:intracellular protein transport protein USO1-like n=1 Tax=Nicotiana sylvestris TaxID=4096 RepID=UPI00388CC9C9